MGTAGSNYTQLHSFTAVAGQNYIIEVKHPLTFTEIDEDGAGGDPQQVPGYLVDPSILQIPDDQDTRMPSTTVALLTSAVKAVVGSDIAGLGPDGIVSTETRTI